MFIVEGTLEGESLQKRSMFVINKKGSEDHFYNHDYGHVEMKNNVISADIVFEDKSTTTGGGVKGAASGAVLGFLIAGPLGTAIGAGLGSRSKTQGQDNITIAITFANGDAWIVDRVKPAEIAKLKVASSQFTQTAPQQKQKITKEEPPPEHHWNLNPTKGRKKGDKAKLPELSILKEWSNEKHLDNKVFGLFKKNLNEELKKYNNFKWVYFAKLIESDKEVSLLAAVVLQNLYMLSNVVKSLEMELFELEDTLINLDKELKESDSKKKGHELELSKAGFFSKGKFKDKVEKAEREINDINNKIKKAKRSKTTTKNKLDKIKDIKDVDDLSTKIELILNYISPKSTLNKKLKHPKKINTEYFLKLYRKVFKEIEDKRIKTAKTKMKTNEVKKEAKLDKSINKETKSVKERLIDLKSMFNEDLITKEEYEEQRKNLISEI